MDVLYIEAAKRTLKSQHDATPMRLDTDLFIYGQPITEETEKLIRASGAFEIFVIKSLYTDSEKV